MTGGVGPVVSKIAPIRQSGRSERRRVEEDMNDLNSGREQL